MSSLMKIKGGHICAKHCNLAKHCLHVPNIGARQILHGPNNNNNYNNNNNNIIIIINT